MSSPRATLASTHIPAIDGLRAVAVFAVLLYHLGVKWLPGGFLGVDLFFVISGYVITRVILDSIQSANGLDLREFYYGRVRRLYPGLLLLIMVTTVLAATIAPDAIRRIVQDVPYVLTGTNNWHLVAIHQDYFQTVGRAPMLQHTWSLAVEAQFYLIWPITLVAIWKRYGKGRIARVALAIAMISGAALFAFSLQLDNATAGRISHIYFGSDTHSLGLFLGAALGVSWIPQNLTGAISKRAQDFIDGIGMFGLFGILCTFLFISESNATLYRLAFPLAGIFGCATLISIVHPASRFAPILSTRPLLWIGQRSYGIYLWHWVIFQVTRPSIDLAGSEIALDLARTLLVLICADISLRYIEIPIRRGTVQNWLRGMKYRTKIMRRRQRIFVATCLSLAIAITSGATATAWYRDTHTTIVAKNELTLVPSQINIAKSGLWVTGDSVILGIRSKLAKRQDIALINARIGRQLPELIDAVKTDQTMVAHATVVLDVGNNNRITKEDMTTLMELLKNQPKIVLVNTAVPRLWRDDNNRIIREVIANYPQTTLVDWSGISANHPEFFAPDGVHLIDAGSDVYVAAILDALNK
ncbi:MAG: acyltransferase family protein [Actinobacteria bacterium]|nr:acyltransferase family protein [Actinomycetota bacterium]